MKYQAGKKFERRGQAKQVPIPAAAGLVYEGEEDLSYCFSVPGSLGILRLPKSRTTIVGDGNFETEDWLVKKIFDPSGKVRPEALRQ